MAVRIYSLAKDLGLDSKELVDLCARIGIQGKGSALASLEDDEINRIKKYLEEKAAPPASAAGNASTPAPIKPVREPIKESPIRDLGRAGGAKRDLSVGRSKASAGIGIGRGTAVADPPSDGSDDDDSSQSQGPAQSEAETASSTDDDSSESSIAASSEQTVAPRPVSDGTFGSMVPSKQYKYEGLKRCKRWNSNI